MNWRWVMDFERRREEELNLVDIFIILLVYFNATLFSSFFFYFFFITLFPFYLALLSCILHFMFMNILSMIVYFLFPIAAKYWQFARCRVGPHSFGSQNSLSQKGCFWFQTGLASYKDSSLSCEIHQDLITLLTPRPWKWKVWWLVSTQMPLFDKNAEISIVNCTSSVLFFCLPHIPLQIL